MGIEINLNSRQVFFDGSSRTISGRQWDILYELIKYETRSFRELKESIWNDVDMDDNILRSPLNRLMELFENYGYGDVIIKGRQRVSIKKEDFGIREYYMNSSIVSSPLEIEDSYYFEHDSEFERLEERLSQDNIVIVASEGGIGKTSLVEYYTHVLGDKHNHTITWQDASDGLMDAILNIQWTIDTITQYQTAIYKLRASAVTEEVLGEYGINNSEKMGTSQNRKEKIDELFSKMLDNAIVLGKCNHYTLVIFDNWTPSDFDYDILLRFKKVGANVILTTRMNDRFKMPPSLERFLLTLKGFSFDKASAVFNEISGTDYESKKLESLFCYCATSQYGDRYLPLLITLAAKIMKQTPFEKKEDTFQALIECIKEGGFVTDTDTEFGYLKTVDGYRSSVFNVIDATYKYAIRDQNPLYQLIKQQVLINISFFPTGVEKERFFHRTNLPPSPLRNTKKKQMVLSDIQRQMNFDISVQNIHDTDSFILDEKKQHLHFQDASYFDSCFNPLVVIRNGYIHNISDEIMSEGKKGRTAIAACIESLISFGYIKEYHKNGKSFLLLHPIIASYIFEVCLHISDVYDEALLIENINRQFFLIDYGKVLPLHHRVFIKMYQYCEGTNENISDCVELLFCFHRTLQERDYLLADDDYVSVRNAEIEMLYNFCNQKRFDIDIELLCRISREYAADLGKCPLWYEDTDTITSNHWMNNAINLSKAAYMRATESIDEETVIDSLKTICSLYRSCKDFRNELIYDEKLFDVQKRSNIVSISELAETIKFILSITYKNKDTDKLQIYLCQICANPDLAIFLEEDWDYMEKQYHDYYAHSKEKYKVYQEAFMKLLSACNCSNGYFSIHKDELINKYKE